MKKYTKKFLEALPKHKGCFCVSNVLDNAKSAEKKIGLPEDLWLELSVKDITKLYKHLDIVSVFMAGVSVGWVEKNDKIK